MVDKCVKRQFANTIHMPISGCKINPLLASVLTGGTVKIGICTGISLVKNADKVVLHGGFVFHVKIKLAVHGFKLITNFVHETILSEFCPTVKSIASNFYSICFVRLHFAEGIISKVFDKFGIYGRYKKVSL